MFALTGAAVRSSGAAPHSSNIGDIAAADSKGRHCAPDRGQCTKRFGNATIGHALIGMSHTQRNAREIEAARKRGERLKAREAQQADAPKAVAEYYAAQQAAIDRIGVLRAQRLARDKQMRACDGRSQGN